VGQADQVPRQARGAGTSPPGAARAARHALTAALQLMPPTSTGVKTQRRRSPPPALAPI
jgi:hypothetical protein